MAIEPERRIEQLLRAYAQKRRGEAPQCFELHPVNRRLLHEEIARLRKETSSGSGWWQVLVQFWRQAALACSILVVLGVVLLVTNPSRDRSQQLAFKAPDAAMDRKENKDSEAARGIENKPAEPLAKANDPTQQADKLAPLQSRARSNMGSFAEEQTRRASGEKEMVDETEALRKSAAAKAGLAAKADPGASTTQAEDAAGPAPSGSVQLRSFGMVPPAPAPRPNTRSVTEAVQPASPAAPATKPAAPPALAGAMGGGYGGAGVANESIKDPATLADEMKLKAQPDASKQLLEKKVEESLQVQLNKETNRSASGPSYFGFGRDFQSNTAARRASEVLARRVTPEATTQSADANWAWKDRSPSAAVIRQHFASLPETAKAPPAEPSPALLDSFMVERAGDRVRITDADGSVYEGELLAANDLDSIAAGKKAEDGVTGVARERTTRQKLVPSDDRRSTAPLNFRAAGTNKTSGQRVEITATINSPTPGADLLGRLMETNAATTSNLGLAMKSVPSRSAPSSRGSVPAAAPALGGRAPVSQTASAVEDRLPAAPLSNAVRIEGTTRIGDREVPLKAVRISK